MDEKDYAFAVVTYSKAKFVETMHSIPVDRRCLVVDNSQTGKPLGWAWYYATQRLCQLEGYKSVIVCNDDVVLRSDTGELLADALLNRQHIDERPEQYKKILLISAYNIRDVDRGSPQMPAKYGPIDLAKIDQFKPRWGTGPDFSCFVTNMTLWDTIGGPDLAFDPCYFEDNDIHYRLRLAGFEALSYAPYFHYGSQTIATDRERRIVIRQMFQKCEAHYIAKWGGKPGHEIFTVPFNGNPPK